MYDQIIKKSPDFTSNTVLSIWEMQDNAVRLSLSSYLEGFGSGQFWIKKGDEWIKIHEGQTYPECSLFENNKVGKGMTCVDVKIQKQRTAE